MVIQISPNCIKLWRESRWDRMAISKYKVYCPQGSKNWYNKAVRTEKHLSVYPLSLTRAKKTWKIKSTTNNGLSKMYCLSWIAKHMAASKKRKYRGKWQEAITHGNVEEKKQDISYKFNHWKNSDSIKDVMAPIKLNSEKPHKIGLNFLKISPNSSRPLNYRIF